MFRSQEAGLNSVSVRRTLAVRLAEAASLIVLFLLARPAFAQITLTGSVSPSQVSYVGTLTYTANASGGDASTRQYAFFRRRPGGTWIPDVNAPTWQSGDTYGWHPTLSDVGTWETYIWVKDGNTPANANTYGYAAGYNTMPIEVVGPPSTPGPTTVACAYSVSDECWVTGDFVASASASTGGLGSISYQICRSNDTTGWGGCDVNLTLSGGTSYTVSGSQLPADGYRRAYYFRAGDSAGAWSGFNTPVFVRVDRYAPSVSASNASATWYSYRTATVSASDSGSGVQSVRYSWNSPLDGNCSTGTATSSGATLVAPNGDGVLYLCARDNTGRVGQWSGQYRVSSMSLTGSVGPSQASYLGSFTWTMSASGGTPATTQYAFFRRVPGGTWVPSVYSPQWQSSNVYTWHPTLSDVGPWETYVWVKDGSTPPDANGYGYAAGFNTMPITVVGPPSTPGPTAVACAYWVASTADCWVAGSFTVGAAASTGGMGSLVYQICRSNDTTGWGGCDVNLTLAGGTSLAVSGADLPADGYRRAYYFRAGDSAGAWSGFNSPAFVRVDLYAPAVSASNASDSWFPSRTATVSASDTAGGAGANSGLLEVRYSWNAALDANCTTGTVTSSGATLTAPAGDNLLYLCARDNVQRVTQWNGRYRVSAPLSLTGSIAPSQASYLNSFTYTANASGGDPATIRYAFFRRRPGGTWIPDVNNPTWSASNTFTWAPTQSDVGSWETYIWVKDAYTPPTQNTYGYAAGFNTMPITVVGPPTAPGPTTVACAYSVASTADCWVTGDFTISAAASTGGTGSLVYQICRSNDSAGGWAGCDVNLTLSGGTSIAVSTTNLPSDGYRRAYYFQAKDSAGALSGWNVPAFVRIDRYPPTVSATNASSLWFSSRTATLSASDSGSGVQAVRYSWNTALDANCTTGTATSSGTTLTAPAGDNVLYLCARDNTGQVGQWSGQYRIAPMTLTGSVSPSQASYLGSFTWTMSASGGTPATTQYAFFRRRPGGTWIPDVSAPAWQAGNTYTWRPAQADVGSWETYVWVKDGDTPPDANTYGYAAGLNTMPITVVGPPTVPGATTVGCAYWVASTADCWVTGGFTVSAAASTGGTGSLVYQICRSNDTAGSGGCDVNLTLSGGTSLAVAGADLPADGYRRAYSFQAKDSAGALSGWNTPAYVRVDRYAPAVGASNASDNWASSLTATVSASDATGGAGANSGLLEVRYSWNAALDANCTTGTVTSPGAALTAPVGDNLLYLCARDNVQRVTQWSGRYRVSASMTLTVAPPPARSSYLTPLTFTATATGGDPSTRQFAFVRRHPGGTWIPDPGAAVWQSSNVLTWRPTLADVGNWEFFVGVKDASTAPDMNGYGYAAGYSLPGPFEVVGPPTVPGVTTMTCDYAAPNGDCWVDGENDIVVSVAPSTGGMGSLVYQICRSNDAAGLGGCQVNLTLNGGTSIVIPAGDLPADGVRQAYYFQARDSAGAVSGWNAPGYLRVDRNGPEVSVTNSSEEWFTSRTATVTATDDWGGAAVNSGLRDLRYIWNGDFGEGCAGGTAIASGTTLTAPAGDNMLYVCARDNVGWTVVGGGHYRVNGSTALTLTGTVTPAKASYPATFTYTATAGGGDAATWQFAFFRRRPGGTWIPDVHNPAWQASNVYTWSPNEDETGTWETYIWVKDKNTPADANGGYGYAAGFNTGPVEVFPRLAVTSTPSPSQAPYGTPITWTATATGGIPETTQFAFFRRRPGGDWIPDVHNPAWQPGNQLTWTPEAADLGTWETYIWVKDGSTPPTANNNLGYAAGTNPGPVEIVAPPQPPDFGLDLTPSAVTVTRGNNAQFTITLLGEAGFADTAALSVSGIPAGTTQTLQPAAIGAGGTATLTVATTSSTPQGTYEITVTGTAGSLTHTATASLTVRPPSAPGEPVITSVTPDIFDGGTVRTVTLFGHNFQGSTVTIATEDPDPDNPTTRVFPTVGQTTVSADGTRIDVAVNCTDPRILDFYALVVNNGVGKAASQPFRVLPAGPVVDLITPNQPERGEDHVYVLSLAGYHLRDTTVSSEPAGVLDIFGVEAVDDTHINGLVRVHDDAPLGNVTVIVRDALGHESRITIEVVESGSSRVATQKINTRRIDPLTGALLGGPSPAVLFQRFAVRQAETTEVTSKGLNVHATVAPERLHAKSFSFSLYYRYTVTLLSFSWSHAFVFDPVTGRIGDEILQNLGLGQKVHFGAFVLSFHLQVDLTVEVSITNTGFTWPLFCIRITFALQIPGLNGIFEQWDYCRGGGWVPFNTGSTSSLNASGGSCAEVTQDGPVQNGLIYATAEQHGCCNQPIEVTGEGLAFTNSWFATSFQVNTPGAGTTTPGQPCNCSISVAPACIVKDKYQTFSATGQPAGGTYQWQVSQGSSRATITNGANADTVTVRGVEASQAADDTELQVTYTNGTSTCTQPVKFSVVQIDPPPAGFTSLEFRAGDNDVADTNNSQAPLYPTFGMPDLGLRSPGNPGPTTGFFDNMEIRARVRPCDPNLRCHFDFKRTREGTVAMISAGGQVTNLAPNCPGGGCDDDTTEDDEDKHVDAAPGCSIFVLDVPGVGVGSTTGVCSGQTTDVVNCLNFAEWLLVDGVRATPDYDWHAATRVHCNSGHYVRNNTHAGNGIGDGHIDCSSQTALTLSPSAAKIAPVSEPPSPWGDPPPTISPDTPLDWVAQLDNPDPDMRVAAYDELLSEWQQNQIQGEDRDQVVSALVDRVAFDAGEGEFQSTPLLAIQLLGEMRAAEAVDMLVQHLDDDFARAIVSDADTLSPAGQALAKIGTPAASALLGIAKSGGDEKWLTAKRTLRRMGDRGALRKAVKARLAGLPARPASNGNAKERERLRVLLDDLGRQ